METDFSLKGCEIGHVLIQQSKKFNSVYITEYNFWQAILKCQDQLNINWFVIADFRKACDLVDHKVIPKIPNTLGINPTVSWTIPATVV